MLRLFFIFYIVFFAAGSCVAQSTDGFVYSDTSLLHEEEITSSHTGGGAEILSDTALYIYELSIPPDTVNAWKQDKKFAYAKNLDSLLRAFQKEREAAASKRSSRSSPSFLQGILSSGFLQILFWAFAIGLVLFILYRLFLNQGIFKRDITANSQLKEIAEEDHKVADAAAYDALIQQSFKLGDYRMAVRYLFLKTLRKLADKGLVEELPDKTNYQYVQEVPLAKKQDFAALVLDYEYIWYGHLIITREQYEKIEKNYTAFYNKI